MAVIRAVYGLPAKCVGYIGLVWAEIRKNTDIFPITRKLRVVFLQSASFISVLSVFLFRACSNDFFKSLNIFSTEVSYFFHIHYPLS